MTRVRLSRLIRVFTWTGLTSLGGGRSAYFYDAVVARRPWVRSEEFVQDLTLSQVLPGPNFANLAVALGYRLGGLPGGAWGLTAIVLPGALILLALGVLYFRGGFSPSVALLMRGMSAAVVGLVLVTTLRIVRGSLSGGRAVVVAALTFAAVGPLRLPTVGTVLVMLVTGLWLHRPRRPAPPPGRGAPETV